MRDFARTLQRGKCRPDRESRFGETSFIGEGAQFTFGLDAQRHEGQERELARELCRGRQFGSQRLGPGRGQAVLRLAHRLRAVPKRVLDDDLVLALAEDDAGTR